MYLPRSRARARLSPAELTDPTSEIGASSVLPGGRIRHDMMPCVIARRPDLAIPEDLAERNADDAAVRAPFGQNLLVALGQIGAQLPAEDFAEATTAITAAATAAMERAFASGAEVLVSSSSVHAPLCATAGYPAITVPLGPCAASQAIGVTLIGNRGEDVRLRAFPHAVERATQARATPDVARDA
jgi:amidase